MSSSRRATVGGLLAIIAIAASACSGDVGDGYQRQTFPVAPGHHGHEVVIGQGRLGASGWELLASQSGDGMLCLGTRWTPSAGSDSDTGCGFGSDETDDGRYGPVEVAISAQHRALAYGPSPRGAARVTLTMPSVPPDCSPKAMRPTTVVITHRVPAWYPNPGTGWFTAEVPALATDCPLDARFVDRNGNEVAQPTNF